MVLMSIFCNGVMISSASSITEVKAEEIVPESVILEQMKILVYSQLQKRQLDASEATKNNENSRILTANSSDKKLPVIFGNIDAWTGQDLWRHLNFIFKIELLPEILTKIVSDQIKDTDIENQGFVSLNTKQDIIDNLKKGNIVNVYNAFFPLTMGRTNQQFVWAELKNTNYQLTSDLEKKLTKIEGKEILNSEKIESSSKGVCAGKDKEVMKKFIDHFNKKFFLLRSKDGENLTDEDETSSPDDLKQIGLMIDKYSKNIKKDDAKFITKEDYEKSQTDDNLVKSLEKADPDATKLMTSTTLMDAIATKATITGTSGPYNIVQEDDAAIATFAEQKIATIVKNADAIKAIGGAMTTLVANGDFVTAINTEIPNLVTKKDFVDALAAQTGDLTATDGKKYNVIVKPSGSPTSNIITDATADIGTLVADKGFVDAFVKNGTSLSGNTKQYEIVDTTDAANMVTLLETADANATALMTSKTLMDAIATKATDKKITGTKETYNVVKEDDAAIATFAEQKIATIVKNADAIKAIGGQMTTLVANGDFVTELAKEKGELTATDSKKYKILENTDESLIEALFNLTNFKEKLVEEIFKKQEVLDELCKKNGVDLNTALDTQLAETKYRMLAPSGNAPTPNENAISIFNIIKNAPQLTEIIAEVFEKSEIADKLKGELNNVNAGLLTQKLQLIDTNTLSDTVIDFLIKNPDILKDFMKNNQSDKIIADAGLSKTTVAPKDILPSAMKEDDFIQSLIDNKDDLNKRIQAVQDAKKIADADKIQLTVQTIATTDVTDDSCANYLKTGNLTNINKKLPADKQIQRKTTPVKEESYDIVKIIAISATGAETVYIIYDKGIKKNNKKINPTSMNYPSNFQSLNTQNQNLVDSTNVVESTFANVG